MHCAWNSYMTVHVHVIPASVHLCSCILWLPGKSLASVLSTKPLKASPDTRHRTWKRVIEVEYPHIKKAFGAKKCWGPPKPIVAFNLVCFHQCVLEPHDYMHIGFSCTQNNDDDDGGLRWGSSVSRPVSENTHLCQQSLNHICFISKELEQTL